LRPTHSFARSDSRQRPSIHPAFVITIFVVLAVSAESGTAQSVPYQRTFSQSKAAVEKTIKEMQGANSGRLPTVEGFAASGDRPLDRFHRAYFECVAQVTSTSSGGSIVRVNATITAWYADPAGAKSGYQLLPSNGRLESDFLDRLQESLTGQASSASTSDGSISPPTVSRNHSAAAAPTPALSAPSPGSKAAIGQSKAGSPFNLGDPLNPGNMPSLATQKAVVDRRTEEEAKGLEEILRNQAHPNNLVAVKKKDTPVLASPSEGAKVLFLAAAEDEFEILDQNPNWVHIRISGLSRGWLRRSSVETLNKESDPQSAETQAAEEPTPADVQPFHVDNEQVATFPGEWTPLHGKTVRIVSILKSSNNTATGPAAKLSFAKSLFDREYADLSKTSTSIAGVVMIFDSEDGGMVSATLPALRQWKSGSLSDEAFLRRCFFDPPEAFGLTANQ
jgi:hypothetical protein